MPADPRVGELVEAIGVPVEGEVRDCVLASLEAHPDLVERMRASAEPGTAQRDDLAGIVNGCERRVVFAPPFVGTLDVQRRQAGEPGLSEDQKRCVIAGFAGFSGEDLARMQAAASKGEAAPELEARFKSMLEGCGVTDS